MSPEQARGLPLDRPLRPLLPRPAPLRDAERAVAFRRALDAGDADADLHAPADAPAGGRRRDSGRAFQRGRPPVGERSGDAAADQPGGRRRAGRAWRVLLLQLRGDLRATPIDPLLFRKPLPPAGVSAQESRLGARGRGWARASRGIFLAAGLALLAAGLVYALWRRPDRAPIFVAVAKPLIVAPSEARADGRADLLALGLRGALLRSLLSLEGVLPVALEQVDLASRDAGGHRAGDPGGRGGDVADRMHGAELPGVSRCTGSSARRGVSSGRELRGPSRAAVSVQRDRRDRAPPGLRASSRRGPARRAWKSGPKDYRTICGFNTR